MVWNSNKLTINKQQILENRPGYFSREQDLGHFHSIQVNFKFKSVEIIFVKINEPWSKMKQIWTI